MFENRLKWFSILLGLTAVVIVGRLVELQVLRAAEFEQLAERIVTQPVRYLRPVRGSIVDRNGRVLASDVSAFDISIHFGVIAGRQPYLLSVARRMRANGDFPEDLPLVDVLPQVHLRIAEMWERLAELTGRPLDEIMERKEAIRARVERISAGLAQPPAREETWFHPVIDNIDDRLALAVRLELEALPWIRVTPGSRRVTHDADHLSHLIGRVGRASLEALQRDPLQGDELRELRPDDLCGTSGVERMAETTLRGRRGRVVEDIDRVTLDHAEPARGEDVHVTIDSELQRQTVDILDTAVAKLGRSGSGAAAVVIDVDTGEVLVLASHPTFHLGSFNEDYDELRRDNRRMPLLFRAVAAQYPPGSTCKAVCLIGGLTDGVIDPGTAVTCDGHMGRTDSHRCWIYNQYSLTHGPLSAEDAVKNSCNIFFYTLGGRMGVDPMCAWFERFGMGRLTGSGLVEETTGVVPDTAWLLENQNRQPQLADAWNYAIGQGEVLVTPLQAANICAAVARGRWAPVRLVKRQNESASLEAAGMTYDEKALRVLRRGMWRVVNEEHGTAQNARLDDPRYVMCGKTGSAQASPFVVSRRYTFEWPDGRRESAVAPSKDDALDVLRDGQGILQDDKGKAGDAQPSGSARRPQPSSAARSRSSAASRQSSGRSARSDTPDPVDLPIPEEDAPTGPRLLSSEIVERHPELLPNEKLPSHAWFIGYTQASDATPGAAPVGKSYAIAVIIEFGGSGGQVAGPAARELAKAVLVATQER